MNGKLPSPCKCCFLCLFVIDTHGGRGDDEVVLCASAAATNSEINVGHRRCGRDVYLLTGFSPLSTMCGQRYSSGCASATRVKKQQTRSHCHGQNVSGLVLHSDEAGRIREI